MFTGQYPSLHGVAQTDGLAKNASDPAMSWLDPSAVPTMGDWFRAGGYRTHYRGKWHVSHADLLIPGTHQALMGCDADGNVFPDSVDCYRVADRLDPFGFSGWIGREPHGTNKADCGNVRDGVFADQIVELFDELVRARADGPWLTVASFVNPHDIAFTGGFWEQFLEFAPPGDTVPDIPEAPSQSDSFDGRPPCHEQFTTTWPKMTIPQPVDMAYRRLYHHLHQLVDLAIGRVLEALEQSGMADETIIVLTSDHGDLLGAHGGMMQKWYNAYDETIRVPMLIKGPGIAPSVEGITTPTSHVDVIPTLMGLAGIDVERAAAGVAATHYETQPLPGRDLSPALRGMAAADSFEAPVYFMTQDDITRGASQNNVITGEPFEAVAFPSRVETVIASLPSGPGGAPELWKLNHYHERLADWEAAKGMPVNPFLPPPAEPLFELHNLTLDPEERHNRSDDAPTVSSMLTVLESERERKRLLPTHRNP
jgi:arylsulfatase A-like enzyme